MRGLLRIAAALAWPLAASAQAPVPYTGGTYTQDFDSIGPAGTNTPPGWFAGVGNKANVNGPLSVGEGNAGLTTGVPGWNFGNTNSTDRSLGTAATGANRVLELWIINDSGSALNAFELHYDGEQWRSATGAGTGAGNDTLDRYRLQFSIDGTNFVEMGEPFNFTVPHPSPATRYDGKQATNRIANIGGTYAPPYPIPVGTTIYLKWFDFNLVGPSDAYLAIDNVTFRSALVAPVAVTQSPESTTGFQCGRVSFSVEVSGSSPAIQWQKSIGGGAFVDLIGETGRTLVVSNLVFPDDNGVQFRAHVSNSLNATDSAAATLTVEPDTTPPAVLRVLAENDLITFTVTYSEAMELTSVVDQSGYQVRSQDGSQILSITSITTSAPTTVSIVTVSPRDPNKNYVLAVNESGNATIAEACNAANVVAPVVVPISVSIQVIGVNDTQVWRFLDDGTDPGPTWADVDFNDSAWPVGTAPFGDPPDELLPIPIRTPLTRGPEAGVANYPTAFFRTHFALPGPAAGATLSIRTLVDDGLILYLNGARIWSSNVVAGAGRTNYGEGVAGDVGNAYQGPFQLDVSNLVNGDNVLAGILYQADGTSSDWVYGVEVNAIVTSVSGGPVTFVTHPQPQTINEGQTAALSVTVEGSQPITFEWQKSVGGGPFNAVPGQTASSLIVPNATPGDSGDYRVVANNPFGPATSGTATLTVNADLTAPTLASAAGSTNSALIDLVFSRPISAATGGNIANYSVAPVGGGAPLTIISATVNGAAVTVNTGPRVFGTSYRLTIRDLRDATVTGNLITPNPTVVNELQQDFVIFSWTHNWRYETNCQDGITWQAAGFNDSAWPSGPGSFGLEQTPATSNLLETLGAPILTPLPTNTTQLAYYFRTTIDWPYSTAGVQFRLSHLVDDGAIFYVNGSPVVSFNDTNPPPLSCTNLAIGGGEASLQVTNLAGVATGQNLLAVEVHQQTVNSSDVVFGAQLVARLSSFGALGPRLTIVSEGANVRITWSPASGTLQFKDNLDDPSWTDVPGQVAGNTVVVHDQLKHFYTLRR